MVIKTDVDQIRHGRLLSLKGKTALQLDEGKLWYLKSLSKEFAIK